MRLVRSRLAALAQFRALRLALLTVVTALSFPPVALQPVQGTAAHLAQYSDRSTQAVVGAGEAARRRAGYTRLEPQAFSESTVETTLFPLKVGAYSLQKKLPDGTAFMVAGNRILLANRKGGFAEIDMSEGVPSIRPLPVQVDLHEEQLREFAAGRGTVDFYLLRVLDLASLNDGRQFAASYTRWDQERKCVSLFVAVNDLPADWRTIDKGAWRIVFESQPCLPIRLDGTSMFAGHQSGGRIVQTTPDTLVLTVGDFEYDGVNRTPVYPQDTTSDYGKIIEVNLKTGAKKMLSMGHRNPQGLAIDANKRLWSTEHGPWGGDELNLIVPGANYGWPLMSYGINYDSRAWPLSPRQGRHDDPSYRAPNYAWVPSLGIGNLIAVRNFAPEWEGDLLVASLRGEQLRRLRLSGESVIYDEPIDLDERLRDIDQLADGRIVIWTDSDRLLVLEKRPDKSTDFERRIASLPARVRATVQSCMQCHSLRNADQDRSKIGLLGIHGRRIAAADPSLYSRPMKARSGTWDDKSLDEFLQNPRRWLPGTTMQIPGIQDNQIRGGVIAFLRTLK
jgi:cytochrome c2